MEIINEGSRVRLVLSTSEALDVIGKLASQVDQTLRNGQRGSNVGALTVSVGCYVSLEGKHYPGVLRVDVVPNIL